MLRQAEEAEWELVRIQPRSAYADAHARGIGSRRLQLLIFPSFETASVSEAREGREWQVIRPLVVETEPALRVVRHAAVAFPSAALAAISSGWPPSRCPSGRT
jgi:hypothetical protein